MYKPSYSNIWFPVRAFNTLKDADKYILTVKTLGDQYYVDILTVYSE